MHEFLAANLHIINEYAYTEHDRSMPSTLAQVVREMYNLFIANPDGTDAFDALCVGAEKFPYREAFSLSTTGIL